MINDLTTLQSTTSERESNPQTPQHQRAHINLITAATAYVKRGWPVIPLHTTRSNTCSCKDGIACQSPGKHPRTAHGLHDASMERDQLIAWWNQFPDANIGVITGTASGLLVLDIDNRNGTDGFTSFVELQKELGYLPITLRAKTGRGMHLYFRYPDVTIRNSVEKIAPGIDVRADGGYVVAPPSFHVSGTNYLWIDQSVEPAELPVAWIEYLLSKSGSKASVDSDHVRNGEDSVIHAGERNDTLYKTGCALRGQLAMGRDEIASQLIAFNQTQCKPPLDEAEVIRIADSVCLHAPEHGPKKSIKRKEGNPLYWFQFNTREWFADPNIMLMDDAQTGQYIRLKALAWAGGGYLKADTQQLWKLANAKSHKAFMKSIDIVLAEYEEVIIEGKPWLRHSELAALYTEKLKDWQKKVDAGNARASKSKVDRLKEAA